MATITLRKSKFDNIQNILDKLGACFQNYESSLNELRHTAEGVDSNTCNLTDAINDIANSSASEKDKVKKIKQLNQKIETFVNTAIQRERRAKDEIVKKKNEFYKKYKHLKPDCEKSILERAADKCHEIQKAITDWIIEHLDIIIAAIIILAAIVIVILCPASVVAIIGTIVCAASAVMGIADMVCMATHGGKGIADVLAENGHDVLAKIWSGTSTGFDIASIILPVGAGVKGTMEVTKQSCGRVVKDSLKAKGKNVMSGLSKAAHPIDTFKNSKFFVSCGENGLLKTLGKSTWNATKSLTGLDDIIDLKNIKALANGSLTDGIRGKVLNDAIEAGNLDNISLFEGEVDMDKVFKDLTEGDKLKMKKNGKLRTNSEMGEVVRNDMQSNFKDDLLDKISTDEKFAKKLQRKTGINTSLRGTKDPSRMTKEQLNKQLSRLKLTLHEDFDRNLIQIVPRDLHKAISHTGGTSRTKNNLLKTVYQINHNEIYDSANYRENSYSKPYIESYKNDTKIERILNKFMVGGA